MGSRPVRPPGGDEDSAVGIFAAEVFRSSADAPPRLMPRGERGTLVRRLNGEP